jgi:hypothetical protein
MPRSALVSFLFSTVCCLVFAVSEACGKSDLNVTRILKSKISLNFSLIFGSRNSFGFSFLVVSQLVLSEVRMASISSMIHWMLVTTLPLSKDFCSIGPLQNLTLNMASIFSHQGPLGPEMRKQAQSLTQSVLSYSDIPSHFWMQVLAHPSWHCICSPIGNPRHVDSHDEDQTQKACSAYVFAIAFAVVSRPVVVVVV